MIGVVQWILLTLLAAFMCLHIGIILKIIPYQMVWGGRLSTDKEMYRFESISIVMNAVLILLVLMQAGFIATPFSANILTYVMWGMTVLFALNTLGNALSKNKIEKRLFMPVTIIMAICTMILALS